MDPTVLVIDHMDIFHEFKEAQEKLTTDQIIELQKVEAMYDIAYGLELIAKALQQKSI